MRVGRAERFAHVSFVVVQAWFVSSCTRRAAAGRLFLVINYMLQSNSSNPFFRSRAVQILLSRILITVLLILLWHREQRTNVLATARRHMSSEVRGSSPAPCCVHSSMSRLAFLLIE